MYFTLYNGSLISGPLSGFTWISF